MECSLGRNNREQCARPLLANRRSWFRLPDEQETIAINEKINFILANLRAENSFQSKAG